MSKISLKIDATQFQKFLKDAPEKVSIALRNVIYKVTLLVERSAKQNTPVDTGRLRSSISTDIRPMSAKVETHTNYALYVHEGTRFISGRPFMRDAAREVSQQVEQITFEELAFLNK